MVKIVLAIVLISMIMILSVHSVVGDAEIPSAPTTDVKDAPGPAPANENHEKSPSWTDWAKNKIGGIENLFASSTASGPGASPEESSASAPAPPTAVKDGL